VVLPVVEGGPEASSSPSPSSPSLLFLLPMQATNTTNTRRPSSSRSSSWPLLASTSFYLRDTAPNAKISTISSLNKKQQNQRRKERV
jgi:hypothetical protein